MLLNRFTKTESQFHQISEPTSIIESSFNIESVSRTECSSCNLDHMNISSTTNPESSSIYPTAYQAKSSKTETVTDGDIFKTLWTDKAKIQSSASNSDDESIKSSTPNIDNVAVNSQSLLSNKIGSHLNELFRKRKEELFHKHPELLSKFEEDLEREVNSNKNLTDLNDNVTTFEYLKDRYNYHQNRMLSEFDHSISNNNIHKSYDEPISEMPQSSIFFTFDLYLILILLLITFYYYGFFDDFKFIWKIVDKIISLLDPGQIQYLPNQPDPTSVSMNSVYDN
jgi:hypothetical protein